MTDETPRKTSQYVTRLQSIERQVGEHVLAALEDPEAVAVLTTIASGLRADRVVSVPLDGNQVADITQILAQAQTEPEEEEDDETTIGFHVILEAETEDGSEPDSDEQAS
jgi:hypothetical protein